MKNLPWILVGVLALALLLTWCMGDAGNSGKREGGDTVWLPVRVDTIRETVIPPPVSEKPAGTDTARLPVLNPSRPQPSPIPEARPEETDPLPSDSMQGEPLPPPDSVNVIIPITEREYRTDDYRLVISGYKPQLRDIEIYSRTQVGIVNPPPQKRKRWSIGPCISWGIGPDGKTRFTAGVSLQFGLLQW